MSQQAIEAVMAGMKKRVNSYSQVGGPKSTDRIKNEC